MASNLTLAKTVLGTIQEKLEALLFRKKRGGGFTRSLGRDTEGYVGLNLAARLPKNRIGISPIVGVSYLPIEDRIEKLCIPSLCSNGATLMTAVGYLTPEKRFLQWVFDPVQDPAPEITRIARAIEDYGLPFMTEHAKLDSFIAELEANRYTINDLRRYRLPVAYWLAGKTNDAAKFLRRELETMRERTDQAAIQNRGFAEAVIEALTH